MDIFPIHADTHIADDMKNSSKLVINTNILMAATRNRKGPSFACCSPAKLFGIPVLNPEQTFQHFRLTVNRSTTP
jgi:hypothetical protein